MSNSPNPYNQAVKPLTIVPVEQDTTVKRNKIEGGLVRHIEKLAVYIQFSEVLTAAFAFFPRTRAQLRAQQNFTLPYSFRIVDQLEWRGEFPGTVDDPVARYTLCVKFIRDDVVYRYKLRGIYTTVVDGQRVPSDIAYDPPVYETTINAPWYNGEKIESNFVLELWHPGNASGQPFSVTYEAINIKISRLKLPAHLLDTDDVLTSIRTLRRLSPSSVLTPASNDQLGINFPLAFPIQFRDYSVQG